MTTYILVVDDESDIIDVVELYLRREGYEVVTANDGASALKAIQQQVPTLMILDIMMPALGGLDVLRQVREQHDVPVIFLSSRKEEVDKIVGLEVGADDYVTKPFNPRELVARVKAVLRRAAPPTPTGAADQSTAIIFDDLTINPVTRQVAVQGQLVELTAKTFDLLWLLASHPGQVFTRDALLNHIWGYNYYGDSNTVTVHIGRLRSQIEPDPANPQYVLTVWGVGYRFAERANQNKLP